MNDDDFNALAGEYVLGLLDGPALQEAEALRAADPRFKAAVGAWELRLLPMAEHVAPLSPPPEVWERIKAQTNPRAARAGWLKKFRWRIGFAAAGLALAGFSAIMLLPKLLQNPAAPEIATLTSAGGGVFVVRQGPHALEIQPENVSLPAGKVAELWVILPNHAPQPAGLFQPGHVLVASLPTGAPSLVLAVSLEPLGGSPTGLPTGPILAEEKITNF